MTGNRANRQEVERLESVVHRLFVNPWHVCFLLLLRAHMNDGHDHGMIGLSKQLKPS